MRGEMIKMTIIGLTIMLIIAMASRGTITQSDNIPEGVSTAGLLPLTDDDTYHNPAYGTLIYTDSYVFTHTYTDYDEFDCWEETEEHPATFKYKIWYQLYLYYDGSIRKYRNVIAVLWVQKDYTDESISWTCFSGHRVKTTISIRT